MYRDDLVHEIIDGKTIPSKNENRPVHKKSNPMVGYGSNTHIIIQYNFIYIIICNNSNGYKMYMKRVKTDNFNTECGTNGRRCQVYIKE